MLLLHLSLFTSSYLSLAAKKLEIHARYDTRLRRGRSLKPDDFLIKEKHLPNWLLHRQTNLLRKDYLIPSNGKLVVQVRLLHYLGALRVYSAFSLPHVPEKIN